MGKRLVSLLTALALAVSAFASLAVAPAGAQPEQPSGVLYFPWVPNGEEYGNMGPWYGSVTVQNLSDFRVRLLLEKADGTDITPPDTYLEPHASKTWSSADLFGDGPGGGVIASVPAVSLSVTRGVTDTDTVGVGVCRVTSVTITQGGTTFQEDTDYIATQDGSNLVIEWIGDQPDPGTTYTVSVTCDGILGGVVKMVSPSEFVAGVWTSDQHESVTGYTSLPLTDVAPREGTSWTWSFPIVQTNNGWNSILHITNFSTSNCSVNVDLYQTVGRVGSAGITGPSEGHFSKLLMRGQTWHLDLVNEYGWPTEWVGTAFVSADCWLGATVDRLKPAQPWGTPVNMAITNVAQPTWGNWTEVYAPLVYQSYNGWNTGISVANLATDTNVVEVLLLNKDGIVTYSESLSIPARAQEFVYLPSNTDVGTNSLAQAIIRSKNGLNLAAAVDAVKYTGIDQDVGQATSYLAQQGTRAAQNDGVNGTLSVALFQKEQGLTRQKDNSGIAFFNANLSGPAAVRVEFFDGAGVPVAPTPITVNLPAGGGAVVYAPWYGEMPYGFRGAVLATVLQGSDVSCVSNNVNYEVQFDGTATYNCFLTDPIDVEVEVPVPTYQLTLDPAEATNLARLGSGFDHTVTATLTLDGDPVPGKPILFEILDGSVHDDAAEDDAGTYNAAGIDDAVVNTNLTGQAQFTVADTGDTGTDTIFACADLNNTGTCDPGEPTATAVKYWVTATFNASLDATVGVNDDTADGNATVTVTGPDGSALPVVLVISNEADGADADAVAADASFAPCSLADQNTLAETAGTASPNNYDIYACAGGAGDSFDVAAYWDVDGSGTLTPGDVQIGGTVTLTLP